MNEEGNEKQSRLTLQIPIIKADSETQTSSHLVPRSHEKKTSEMEVPDPNLNIRKRRNLSKNRAQAARHREQTPEPGRTPVPHEDTTTSDDEDPQIPRNSREIEADNTYEEMKRLVQEKANYKDPVYDIDTDEILEARAKTAHDRRRRSVSPFALPDKDDMCKLERRGSFVDPTNKLLSTNYIVSPKDEDPARRNSLTIETSTKQSSPMTPPSTAGTSPVEKNLPFSLPTTPKKLTEMVYPDEIKDKLLDEKSSKQKTPTHKESIFTFEEKEVKHSTKSTLPKTPDTPAPGEIITKVIQVERTPSKKLTQESKPVVEVRERIVRTPSRKSVADAKPTHIRQSQTKTVKDEAPAKTIPVKPARSKSASRLANKTSESEVSEDQLNQHNVPTAAKRKVFPTPRRFVKNKSPRANRSQSVARVEDVKIKAQNESTMSQTSKEILDLMERNRARSLSIPKDDLRLPAAYKNNKRTLITPNKTPASRASRGISCPKTIQIISDKEILSGLITNKNMELGHEKRSKHSYTDISQSEYTSSCYSSSASENDYEFDLIERTAELTRKLNLLSKEVESRHNFDSVIKHLGTHTKDEVPQTSVLRKRHVAVKSEINRDGKERHRIKKSKSEENIDDRPKASVPSKWRLIANWQQFKQEHWVNYMKIKLLLNRCICDVLILVIFCGLGGMMFKTLEGSFENAYKCGTRNVKRDFIESLWRGSHHLREEEWKSMARKKLYEFEEQLHTAHEAGITSYSGQRSWNFMNSFVYCLTIITTIGYGHIAPKTTYGRVATIVYAIIGIPLFLIVLADFGKLFTRIIKFFWAYIRRFYYTRSCRKVRRTVPVQEVMKGLNIVYDVVRRPSQIFNEEDFQEVHDGEQPPPLTRKPSDVPPPLPPKPGPIIELDSMTEPTTPAPSVYEIDDEFNLPISVAIFILIVYIIIGAVVYNIWEKWNFFECFYFVFISMSTIGLGDLVPDHPMFMMASILYLVFGLALTSMCINVVQVKLSNTFKQASAKLGATIGLKVAEEDGSLVPMTPAPTEIVPVHKSKTEKGDSKRKEADDESNDR